MNVSDYIMTGILVAVLFLTACSGIFVPDPIDPRVPKYTEDGNEVAGALIDGNAWRLVLKFDIFNPKIDPVFYVWNEKDSLAFCFSGGEGENYAIFEFMLTGQDISSFDDLLKLNERKIQLDGVKNSGYYSDDYSPDMHEDKGIGQIYFKHVSKESGLNRIIVSGTFGFSVQKSNGETIDIRSGRFDFTVSDDLNFLLLSNDERF